MNKLKKTVSAIISLSLMITTLPVNSFSASYPVLPQYEFSNFAKITSANFCENSDTTIINIQDLHNNKDVQDNIYKLLEKLNQQCADLDVYIEGASDFIDYSKMASSLNEEQLNALMESLYANDKLSGAEFFGYKNNKILKPTEQKNIYDRNIQNYSFLIKNKQQINELLSNKYTNIKNLNNYLIKDQISLLKFYNAYLNKKISSEFFYKKVLIELSKRKISSLKYINTKLYIDVLNASKNINQKLAERQLQTVLTNLKNTITYQEYVNLLQDSKNLSDINVVFAYLSEKTNSVDKFTKYPDLFKLISLREISSLINPLDLVEEEREMMEDILLSYSKTVENKEVVFINLFFQIYKKLLLASVSSNEYIYYKQNYGRFANLYSKYIQNDNLFDLYRYLVVAENFNELNLERNISFVDNLVPDNNNANAENNYRGKFYNIDKILSGLDKTKNVKVIISGGFHTEGVNELLKKKQVSYITLTPNVKESDPMYEQNYLDSIVEQAQVDTNAISKRPFLEQKAPIIVDNVIVSLNSMMEHFKAGKSLKEVEDIINGAIRTSLQNSSEKGSVEDFITLRFDSNGKATIIVDEKEYVLTFENGKLEIEKDSSTTTTLSKNIKLLIKRALGIDTIKMKLSVSDQDSKSEESSIGVANQIAANLLLNQNILLPWFANRVMRAIIGLEPADDVTSSREYKVLEEVLKEQYKNLGEEYPDIDSEAGKKMIQVGKSPLLVGARQDRYGNAKEYASLFYVVWGTNSVGANIVKEIYISNTLFSYLEDFTEKEIRQFFQTLITHERLEIIAVSGESKRYNSHYKDFARTPDGFHKYIKKGSDFAEFIREQGYSSEVVQSQRKLLEQLDEIISEVNEENSEYSGIISLVSMDEDSSYSDEDIARFLAVRSGEEDTISQSKIEIADEICKKLKQEYDLSNPAFDIKSFVKFVNDEYVFVYKKSNEYMLFDELPNLVKKLLKEKYVKQWSNSEDVSSTQIDDISFPVCEVDEETPLSLEQKEKIYGRNIFFVEDIISRNSKTYNRIFKKLRDSEVAKVQPFVFFDLSKEPKGSNFITEKTYDEIIKNPQLLLDVISKTNGEVKKYIFYWLIKLSKDSKGIKVLQQLAEHDSEITRNLMVRMFDILEKGETILNVKNTEIVELILLMGLGEKKSIADITQQDLAGLLEKYNIKFNLDLSKPLTVKYDDWKDNIPYLITYAYMCGYNYVDANGINNIYEKVSGNETNRDLIEQFCKKFNISLIDKKTKLKYFHFSEKEIENAEALIDEKFTNRISKLINEYKNAEISYSNFENFIEDELQQLFDDARVTKSERIRLMKEKDILKRKYLEKGKMERAKYHFEKYAEFYERKYTSGEYSYDEYVERMERIEKDYIKAVRNAMINAKNIALDELKLDKILMNDSMFAIIIGGSLAKGNSMKDSDIYYDIIVKNGVISKSIEQYFTPLYSSILRDLGLVNYQILKYSTTSLDKMNINTLVAEQEVAPFLNYEVLEADKKECVELYEQYMNAVMNDSLKETDSFDNLDFIAGMYHTISETGKGWIGKSFYSIYSENRDKIFTTRWSLMAFEAVLNKMIFQSITEIFSGSDGFSFSNLPISVEEQVDFLKHSVFSSDKEKQKKLDEVLNAWRFLSVSRYENNNTWTDFSQEKKKAIDTINDFVKAYLGKQEKKNDTAREVKDSKDFLKVIEEFVYDNSTNLQVFRIGYDKYSHLDQWKQFADEETNGDVFVKAQAIALLLEMDDIETIKNKLENLNISGLDKYLPSLFKSLDAIKKIDEQFKDFKDMQGERSLQNYWDLVAKTAENEETLLALIAHKLTQAKYPNPEKYQTEEEMNEAKNQATLLVHSVYLPLSRRFGNSDMYEYVRNDLFEISNPQEYLNLLNIIETLYGVQYTEFKGINEDIKMAAETILKAKGLPEDSFTVKFRPKSLYSIHEKLNSERRKGEIIHTIGETEKGLVKFILTSDNSLFKEILESAKDKGTKKADIEFILKHIDTDYDSLNDKQKAFVNKLVAETRSKIFADYEFVDYIKKIFNELPKNFVDISGLREMGKLREYLVNNKMWVELFFMDIFGKEIRDLIGLHIVIDNEEYDKYISDDMIREFSESFGRNFDKFERDYNNKQARIKFSALKKSLPIEACLYKRVDYEEEIYGFYNLETLSAPHYQYKTGRKIEIYPEIEELIQELKKLEEAKPTDSKEAEEIENKINEIRNKIKLLMNLVLFDGTFIHEIALKFVVKELGEERKQFVFTPDEYDPGKSLEENRRQIFENKNLGTRTIFFVEYEEGYFVMDLPKDATVSELMSSKYFADTEVAVYDEDGEPLGMDVKLEDAKVYKIIKTEIKGKTLRMTEEELKRKPIRTQLQYLSKNSSNKSISTILSEKITKKSDLSELAAYLLFYEDNNIMLDNKELSKEQIIDKFYDADSRNEILRNKKLLAEVLDIISRVMEDLELEDISPSVFIKRSVMIANHYNLSNMFELFEALDYGVINYSDIINYYKTCIFIKTKSKKVSEQQILELLSDKLGAEIIRVDTRKRPNSRYNLIINDRKYFVDYEGYEFDAVQDLLESQDIHFEYVADKSSREIGKKENKEKIFITMDFVRPRKFLPLMSLGNNVGALVQHAMINHSGLVSIILQDIKNQVISSEQAENPEFSEEEIRMLPDVRMYSAAIELVERTGIVSEKIKREHPGEQLQVSDYEEMESAFFDILSLFSEYPLLITQILLGLYSRESYTYDEQSVLSQETPYLSREQVNIIAENIKNPDLSEISDLLEKLGLDTQEGFATGISNVNFVISRSLDLVENASTFSFATLDVNPETGTATVYISEAFLRELDKKTKEEKEELLKQLALHEIIEYFALTFGSAATYEDVHAEFENYQGQKDLMSFAKSVAVPNTLRTKEALYQEVDTLLSPSDFSEMEPQSTIGLLLGNLSVSSFVRTYRLYREGKLSKIFISGNTRGSLGIIRNLRNPKSYPEHNNLVDGIKRTKSSKDIRTVEDLLSLNNDIFAELTKADIDSVQVADNEEILLLDESITSPVSRNEIFYLVSRDGVTEAAIIKWIILESARQDGLTRKEINQLINSIVLETKASNTPENIANIFAKKEFKDFIQDKEDIDVVVIQTPFSQTRAGSTLKKFLNENATTLGDKNFDVYNMSFDITSEAYHYGNIDALTRSLGEWTRLIAYALKGDIVPLIGKQEGLKAIPLDILVNLLSLLPVLNAKEKANLYKVFSDAAKQDSNFETADKLLKVLEQQIGNKEDIEYILISEFIKYIYADTTEQRQLEKDWDEMIIRQEMSEVDLEQELSLENRMETMQSILSAA